MNIIFLVIILIVLVIWAVVGFIMWIPMLFRGIAVYSSSLTYAATVNAPPSYMKRRDVELQRVTKFYMQGFSRIFQMYKDKDTQYDETNDPHRNESMKIGRFLIEILWTLIFWFGILFLFHPTSLYEILAPYK